MNNKELIFVYNADSGSWNGYLDMMHKVFSPKTYACNLCSITHGTFSMKQEWATFIDQLPVSVLFLHRDEWEAVSTRKDELPAIFLKEGGTIRLWLPADSMNKMDLKSLKQHLSERMHELR